MMSNVVPRSWDRVSTEGASPFSVSGAAVTIPQEARCSSVPAYPAADVTQSWPKAIAGSPRPSCGV